MAEIQRFCPSCGHPVDAEDEFCPYCGKKLSDIDEYRMTGDKKKKKESTSAFSVDGRTIDGTSTLALVLGIAAFVVPYGGLICAIIAIVLGSKYRKRNTNAKVGFVLGIVACCFTALYTLLTIVFI